MKKYRVIALAALAAMAVAGCGGDDDDSNGALSPEEFGTELNSICTEYNPKVEAAGENLTPEANQASADALGEVIGLIEDLHGELEDIEAPEELASTYDDVKANFQSTIDLSKEAQTAAGEGDEDTYVSKLEEVGEISEENDALALELGAGECAN